MPKVYTNFAKAGRAIKKVGTDLPKGLASAMYQFTGDIYDKTVEKTPVDTGRARGGWQILSKGQRGSKKRKVSSASKVGQKLTSTESSYKESKIKEAAFKNSVNLRVQNNVEYISALEYGHSKAQAPHGIVRRTVAELRGEVHKYKVKIGSGNLVIRVRS